MSEKLILSKREKPITFEFQKEDYCIYKGWRESEDIGNYYCPFVEKDYDDGHCTTYRCMIDKKGVGHKTKCRISYKNELEGRKLITEVRVG